MPSNCSSSKFCHYGKVLNKYFNPFPNDKFHSSKLKESADNNFKFDGNGRKFSKQEENTAGKGEIAHYKQFLIFQLFFRRLELQTHKNQGLFGKGLNLNLIRG